jgi:hypothetical protein
MPKTFKPTTESLKRLELAQLEQPIKTGDDFLDGLVSRWVVTPATAASILGCSTRTLERLNLSHVHVGRDVRYDINTLRDFITTRAAA